LDFFADHVGRNIEIEKISPRLAESFVSERLASKLSPATVNKDIRTLKGIFNLAIEPRGYLAEGTNPFRKIKQRKIAKKNIRYVPVEDFSKVIDVLPNLWWKTFLAVAYTSGGRKNELLNLTWVDIDFANNNVSFMPKKATENILAWEPKDHESRVIPVPEKVIHLLANMQSQTDESSPYVFINRPRLKCILERRNCGKWHTRSEIMNNMLTRLKVFCKRAGVKEFCLHDLRRSCITNWAGRLPIHAVQEFAGHSDMETTREFYLSVGKSDRNLAREIQENIVTKLTNF
jgi:integrase